MGVYEPLTRHLRSLPSDSWSTNFSEIEKIIRRPLPSSAYDYRPWWGNQKKGNHSQARAWRDAGWETRDVDLKRKTLRFERVEKESGAGPRSEAKTRIEDLWEKARTISGISDRDELIEAALTAFIQREAARRLAEMGGTMPDAKAPPRRRFF
jgi:hypothetical protein